MCKSSHTISSRSTVLTTRALAKGARVANLREHLIGAERFRFGVRAQ
jgi:hypothetical protein